MTSIRDLVRRDQRAERAEIFNTAVKLLADRNFVPPFEYLNTACWQPALAAPKQIIDDPLVAWAYWTYISEDEDAPYMAAWKRDQFAEEIGVLA